MKILLFFILTCSAWADDILLVWDANPTTEQVAFYNVYKANQVGKTTWERRWTLLGSPTASQWLAKRQTGAVFRVTAVNAYGEGPGSFIVSP